MSVCVCSRLLAGAGVQAETTQQKSTQRGTLLFVRVACAQLPCCTGSLCSRISVLSPGAGGATDAQLLFRAVSLAGAFRHRLHMV